jgi:hypothetical protein
MLHKICWQQWCASTITTVSFITLFVNRHDNWLLPLVRLFFLFPDQHLFKCLRMHYPPPPRLNHFCWNVIRTWRLITSQLSNRDLNLSGTRVWHKWLWCVNFSLPNTPWPLYIQLLTEVIFPPSQNLSRIRKKIAPLILYELGSRLVTLLKIRYAPIQVSDVLILIVSFKPINFVFQISPFLVPEMSTSFPPYITHITFIHFTGILQPL